MAHTREHSNLLSALVVMLALLATAAHAQQDTLIPSAVLVDAAAGATGQALLVVPETAEVAAVSSAAAAAAAIRPEVAATTVRLRRTSRREAAAALRKAQPWRPLLTSKPASAAGNSSTDSVDPQAICGTNSLVADNSFTNCRIVTTYSNGVSTSCSASKIASNILATAGHCLYTKPNGGWASSIDVYCTGAVTCNVQRTTYATKITTTPSWVASVTTIPTAWDGAVIQTAGTLPGQVQVLGQYTRTGSYRVKLTGYPAQSGDPGCSTSAFAGACYQYSSTDTMDAGSSGMYSSTSLDLCSGHSGSGVYTPDSNRYITAIVTGASFSPCQNFFVPQINNGNGVNKDCEKPEGGVSFACLAGKLA